MRQAAQAFEEEFRTYLTPGLLEGPELAETIAELEGLPGQWVETTGENIVGLTNGEKTTLVRQPEDWHPYNPDAEQEARIAAEGDVHLIHCISSLPSMRMRTIRRSNLLHLISICKQMPGIRIAGFLFLYLKPCYDSTEKRSFSAKI